MIINDVIEYLEKLSPPAAACSWDNIGLMAGDRNREVSRILVTLDVDDDAVDKAIEINADMIVSHHPLIFGKISRVTGDSLVGKRLLKMIENHIACYSMHTNFDVCGGMGQLAADVLGLHNARTLEVTLPSGDGLGRIADVRDYGVMTAVQWAKIVKEKFEIPNVKLFGDVDKKVYSAAIYPGSGKDAIDTAIKEGADILITGDIGHHAGIDAAAAGLTVIDAGHYGIEHIFVNYIAGYIKEKMPVIEVTAADTVQPFVII